MGFADAVRTCFSKYVTFSGRARRPEYWWFVLFIFLGSIVFALIDGAIFGFGTEEEPAPQVLGALFSLGTFLPVLAAGWRRMHDTGKPGWYLLIPLVVSLVTLAFLGLGVAGLGAVDNAGMDFSGLGGLAAGLGLIGVLIASVLQLVLMVLLIWWLTRPTQPGANQYGPEPAA